MKPYNKRLLFWADIAEKYPELLGILPKDMIANAWEYNAAPDFTKKIKPFRDAGLDVFVSPGANNWVHIWPNFDVAFVNVRNFVRDGQKFGALGMLNTTWDDDGEALFGMTWPALVLGAGCSWQQGECSIERFLNSYDWAFYRNSDNAFRDVIQDLDRTHQLMGQARLGGALNEHFWVDPFTETGSHFTGRALPVMHDLRLAAEHALESLLRNGDKARLHADTLNYMTVAAMRLDLLGMKVQFADEINSYYRDAYSNQQDRTRVRRDMVEITSTNARLEDLRDATTRVRGYYSDLWLKENRPYWLGNVQVRYDSMAAMYQEKIQAVRRALVQFRETGKLPPPEQLGFYTPSIPAALPAAAPSTGAAASPATPPPPAQTPAPQPQPAKPPQ
jgi:hexosaminidase